MAKTFSLELFHALAAKKGLSNKDESTKLLEKISKVYKAAQVKK